MPALTFDNLLLVSFVFPLAAAAIPLCATAKTLDDWFLHREPKEAGSDEVEDHGRRMSELSSTHSLTSVPEEDEDQDETLIEQTSTPSPPTASSFAVALKLFDDEGQEAYLRRDDDDEVERQQGMGRGGEEDSEDGRFDSFTSEFSKNYSTATSPAATLPSHFNRAQQNHPSVQSLFETYGARSDSPVPPHLLEEDVDDAQPRSGSTTPSASHFREASNGSSTASYTTTRSGGRVSTSESENDQPQIVMINNDPSSLDHPPTPYPFSPGHDAPSHSIASSNSGTGSSAFTFRSALDYHHSGQLQQAEEEEVGLITPRASPEVALGPVLHPEAGEKDVRFDERVGVIGAKRGKGKEAHSTGQELFPSPPPSHESSPSIQFSFDSPSHAHAHAHASRDASSVSQVSTTAPDSSTDIEQAEREKFADFRADGGGEGEDGLGLELRKGRKNLKRFEQDEEEDGRGRLGGMMGSRSLRDRLKTDRPISTISTSSTHAHLGSPQFPYFLPSSHSKPNLTPSSGSDAGSAVSTLRLTSPPDFHHHSSDDHFSSAEWETSPDPDGRARNNTASTSTSSDVSVSPTLETASSSSASPTTSFLIGGAEEREAERKKAKKAKQRAKEKEKKKEKGGKKGGK